MAKRKSKEERFQEVLAAACQLFYRQGYDRTSVLEIAQALNLEKATLYHYIKGKEELLYLLLKNFLTTLRVALQAHSQNDQALIKLPLILTEQVKLFLQKQKEAYLYFKERRCLTNSYKKEIEALEEEYLEELSNILKKGFHSSFFRTPRQVALAFLGLISALIDHWQPKDSEREKIAKDWVGFFLSGKTKKQV